MSIKVFKKDLDKPTLIRIKQDCLITGKSDQFGRPPIVNTLTETENSFYIPFNYALKIGYKQHDNFPIINYKMHIGLKDNIQKEIVKEAIDHLKLFNSAFLSIFTGCGKTYLSIYLAQYLGLKTAFLAHRTVLIDQFVKSVQKFTDARVQVVTTNGELDPKADFYVFNMAYVSKRFDSELKEWVPKKIGRNKEIGTLIVDEAHLICAYEMSKAFAYFSPKYTIALTATPERPDGLDKVLDLYFGRERIIRISKDPFTVYRIPTGIEPESEYNKFGKRIWSSVIDSLSVNEDRNKFICKILDNFKDKFILILTRRVSQRDILAKMLKNIIGGVTVFKAGSKSDYDKNARVLITTTDKGGVGFDDTRFEILLLGCDVKRVEQYAGRLRQTPGKKRIILHLVDDDHSCNSHWLECRRFYISRNGTILNYYKDYPKDKPEWLKNKTNKKEKIETELITRPRLAKKF